MKLFVAAPAVLAFATAVAVAVAAQGHAKGANNNEGILFLSRTLKGKRRSKKKSSNKKDTIDGGFSSISEIPSCPNFVNNRSSTTTSRDSKKRSSKKKSDKGNTCAADTSVVEVICGGENYVNSTLTLSGDLFCDGDFTFITMEGPSAILDCNDFKITNILAGEGIGVELIDGASIVNCNIANVEHAVVTSGEGCTTIQNVAASFTDNDSFFIQNLGTTIMTDIKVDTSDADGIEVNSEDNSSTDGAQLVVINNAHISGTYGDGIDLLEIPSDGSTVQLYGDITLRANEDDGINVADNFNLEIFGSLTILGPDGNGIGVGADDAVVTFAASSSSTLCFSFSDTLDFDQGADNPFIVEAGAFIVCDTASDALACDAPCVSLPASATVNQTAACTD